MKLCSEEDTLFVNFSSCMFKTAQRRMHYEIVSKLAFRSARNGRNSRYRMIPGMFS
jgi:hypothetical protein